MKISGGYENSRGRCSTATYVGVQKIITISSNR